MLFLTKSDYEKMLAHCKKGLPNEACGLIGGVVEGEKQYVKKVYLRGPTLPMNIERMSITFEKGEPIAVEPLDTPTEIGRAHV